MHHPTSIRSRALAVIAGAAALAAAPALLSPATTASQVATDRAGVIIHDATGDHAPLFPPGPSATADQAPPFPPGPTATADQAPLYPPGPYAT